MTWKYERRWNLWRARKWSIMIDFGVAAEPYWRELQTKGQADRLRSFPVVGLYWDRMEFNQWGVAQGPGIEIPFLKMRFWFIR